MRQTSKNVENINRDINGFDLRFDEFCELCRETWKKESSKYVFFDGYKKENEEQFCIRKGSKENLISVNRS